MDRQFADQVVREVLSAKQMQGLIREALDNWDFDAIEDGTGPKQQKALEDLEHNALKTFRDGFEVPRGFGDVFDWLAEWAVATAADM